MWKYDIWGVGRFWIVPTACVRNVVSMSAVAQKLDGVLLWVT